ncbi:MAG: RlpA-like double-psi beta-barrel-protein domain-containing protein-containing protein [Benjaminiella poitrasii]|nr:MAG: RlpA-like double-psi beta-barrel-protein domain-containing protein-containing protein [Benjaminiella poitrasii]
MQLSQTCILVVLMAMLGHTLADISCKLSIEKAKIRASDSHIRIRGRIDIDNEDCKPTTNKTKDVTTQVLLKSKKNLSFKDANDVVHSGNECTITAAWYNTPDEYRGSKKSTQVFVPLRFVTDVKCNKDNTDTASTTTAVTKSRTRTRRRTTTKKTSKKTTRKTTKKTTKRTTKKKTTKKSSSSSDNSNEHYSGQATFFTPNQGACGDWNDNDDYIAALSGSLYGSYSKKSSYCGKKVKVVNKANGKSVTVTVKDACESCDKTHIDLSPAAFGEIGDYDTGILKVDWYVY